MKAGEEKICRDLVAYIAQPPLFDDERRAHASKNCYGAGLEGVGW
jgi:hypothetical protein